MRRSGLESAPNGNAMHGQEREGRSERPVYHVSLEVVDPDNTEQLAMLLDWFKDQRIVEHLVGVPETVGGLRDYYRTPGVHGFIGNNPQDGYVSVGTIRDPGDPEAYARTTSGLVERVCVRPDLQKRKGIGMQTALKLLDKGFSAPEEGGFGHAKLGLGVVVGPHNWDHAREMWHAVGFWNVGTRVHEIVIERGGRKEPKMYDVLLMETSSGHFNQYIKHHLMK